MKTETKIIYFIESIFELKNIFIDRFASVSLLNQRRHWNIWTFMATAIEHIDARLYLFSAYQKDENDKNIRIVIVDYFHFFINTLAVFYLHLLSFSHAICVSHHRSFCTT